MGVLKKTIPYEVTSYKDRFFFGLTIRQSICVAGGLALIVPTVFFGVKAGLLINDELGYIVMLEALPFAAFGWLKYNDMPFEQYGIKAFKYYFGNQHRKWKTESIEETIHCAEMDITLDEDISARKQEISEEKERIAEEKKQRKLNKKANRREKRKRGNSNA